MRVTRYLLGQGLLCEVYRYDLQLEKPWRFVCGYVVLPQACCYSCCADQERMNTFAVAKAPHCFFQPRSWHLAYHGFSEQYRQWDTARQLVSLTGSAVAILSFLVTSEMLFTSDVTFWFWCQSLHLMVYLKCRTTSRAGFLDTKHV